MKKQGNSLLWLCIATISAVSATMLMLSYMVTDPGHVMNELGGDCGKNYFTFLYHSIYDNGVWFTGMNYPYGEHIIYADGQPVISTFLQLFQPLDPHYALATMNLLISFSYVLAIIFTYKILMRFGVKPFIAILFAVLINLLSPQVMRVRAHFGLSYLCPIPMLFYWTILYQDTDKWKWALYILIMGVIIAFIHLYLGGIIFIWIAFYIIGCIVFIKAPFRQRIKKVFPLFTVAALLFLWIKIFIALTDPVKDRPAFPLNTFDTVTHIRDVITSPFSPVWQFAYDKLKYNRVSPIGNEGFCYLGLVAICIILLSIFSGIINKIRNKQVDFTVVSENNFSPIWLFIAFGSLILAIGAPFIWHLEWLLNYMSIFKQFRAMGRFSWIFYFISTVYATVTLNNWYNKIIVSKRKLIGYAVLFVALFVWGFEVSGYVKYTRDFIAIGRPTSDKFFLKNEMKWPEYLAEHHYKADDFQAILLLPLFVSGSEKLWVGGDPSWPLSLGMSAATELHLPFVDVMMSRTSWSETEKQVKTAAGPYADKPMLRDLRSHKPFLLMWFDGEDLDRDQEYLLQSSNFIGNAYRNHIYACYPDSILANDKKNVDSIKKILPHMTKADTCLVDKGPWIIDHYDTKKAAYRLFGAGACAPIQGEDSVIFQVPFKVNGDSVLYEYSGWFLLDDKDYRSPYLNLKQFDSTGKEVAFIDALTSKSVDNYGMWFRASVYVYIKGTTRSIKMILNNLPKPTYLAYDEFQLRPADAVIVSKDKDGKVMVNNHLVNMAE